ncbi:hypothetical protein RI570_11690 [Brucella pseudogrignonensis]|uniref:hypothetical protein n=1 Tax=Brucella pseudogrignonensis TaxID=419475 RepID=UPI0028B8F39E|nr:hypothetical protein [Brucella pseudogrignonensis]MDT6940810.1 hypothetical protein [Brucella pseudogrignonensis]
MPTVPLEMNEILEESTIVRDALDDRRLASRRNRPPLLRSDGVSSTDRERPSPTIRRNVPLTVHNLGSSVLRSEAIDRSVDESLSNFHSQYSRPSVARPDFTRLEGIMAQMQEMERVLMNNARFPNPRMVRRFEMSSVHHLRAIHSSNLTHRSFLGFVRENENVSVESITRMDFSDFDWFVSSHFPLPSYQESLNLPALPKYSMNEDIKKQKTYIN